MYTLHTCREIPATPEALFAAIQDPTRLARWWGPDGFTNRFTTCEFVPGGRWVFTMHGPDGAVYPNESRFVEIVPNQRVVIEHTVAPHFWLTIRLEPHPAGTLLQWEQVFDEESVAQAVLKICGPANEQNLDRLTAEVLSSPSAG